MKNQNILAISILTSSLMLALGLYITFAGKKAVERECTVAATQQPISIASSRGSSVSDGGGFSPGLYYKCMQKRGY